MCGIAGIASFRKEPINPQWAQAMSSILRHRGPDDEGFTSFSENKIVCSGGNDTPSHVWGSSFPFSPTASLANDTSHVALIHRRLSILDISARGHQPMCDVSQRFWIVFNGEIYNYVEIRQELETLGYTFSSQGDTEVILYAYLQWGNDCVQKFNGMWAFAIYDSFEKKFFCARDRFGVKPFYYFLNARFFAFASEQKALLTLPFIEKRLNEEAVFDYLVLMQTEIEETSFFKDIIELMPGCHLQVNVSSGHVQKTKYYTLPYTPERGNFDKEKSQEYATTTRELLSESVRLRLRSDVPVGACLSGGIDSSSLVCLADRLNQGTEPLHVFTASYPGLDVDESAWAKKIVDITGTQWHQVETKKEDLLSDYENLIYTQDIPFFGSSTLSQHKVMQLIQQKSIKVTLDGQGADELFSGYNRHLSIYLLELMADKNVSGLARYFFSENKTQADPTLKMWLRHLVDHYQPSASYSILKKSKYNFKVLREAFWAENQERYFTQRQEKLFQLNPYLHKEYTGSDLKYLMRTADRNSMRHSVESRVPFADDVALAEYVFSLPSVYKIQEEKTKALLRKGMEGILPETIRLRLDKKGFVTPEYFWFKNLKNELKEMVTDNLEPFVDVPLLKKNWDDIFENQLKGNTLGISRFVILSLWRKRFGI